MKRAVNPETFKRLMGRAPGRTGGFRMPVSTKTPPELPQAALYHYWHPDRDGSVKCPASFQQQLNQVAGQRAETPANEAILRCCKPASNAPIRCRCWLVWYRKPAVTHNLSPGWLLLVAWHDQREPHPTPLALDNRLLANLYLQSAQVFGGSKEYFDHILKTIAADKAAEDKRQENYRHDRAKDYFQSTKIKNIGPGNRFALHHDGTLIPSRGEQNWLAERERHSLPSSVAKAEKDRR